MVRGNWQKRVETAQARRLEAKQRKQRSDDKRVYKSRMQTLLLLLDRHQDSILHRRKRTLHIWTDTRPSGSPPNLLLEQGGKPSRRTRSNSVTEAKSSKKVHPRSKEASVVVDTEDDGLLLLCKHHFFSGKCQAGTSKKGGCRHIHYGKNPYKSLFAVVTGKQARKELTVSEQAAPAAGEDDTMDMVYYISVDVHKVQPNGGSLSECVTETLSNNQVRIASVVYVALDDALLFDRYREGVLYNEDRSFLTAIGLERRASSLSIASENDGDEDVFHLTGPVLEYILMFLPDAAVAAASQVCKSWHYEIGQNSSNLWRQLLERRQWPMDQSLINDESDNVTSQSNRQRLREVFVQHYTAMRDVRAIQSAVGALMHKRVIEEKELSYQDFSTLKHAPSFPSTCVGVQVWSPNRVLAAYSHDCSLRLFETTAKAGSEEMHCRELVCQRVDPYRNTKKRTCQIVSMGLDEEAIGCLCHVMADTVDAEAYILNIMSRDDFLLGESSAVGDSSEDVNFSVIDIGEAVLNYLLSCDEVDHRLLQMIDFISDGGELGDVEVLVSQTMAACGHGRFMIEVSISIPVLDTDDVENDETILQLLDRKLILFSSNVGAIVWMGESHPLSVELRPRHEDMSLAYLRKPQPGASRATCTLAITSSTFPAILVCEIEPTGQVQHAHLVEGSDVIRSEILDDGWEVSRTPSRVVVVTPSDIIAADTMFHSFEGDRPNEIKSVISFFPFYRGATDPLYSFLVLTGNLEVVRMAVLCNQHLVVLCKEFTQTPNEEEDVDIEDLGGQWFAAGSTQISVHAVTIHIPTRREIGRAKWIDSGAPDSVFVPHMTVDCEGTIGVGLSWKGIIMTGSTVRDRDGVETIVLDDAQPKSSKKKKKKRSVKGGKKDGFARGMSLRG